MEGKACDGAVRGQGEHERDTKSARVLWVSLPCFCSPASLNKSPDMAAVSVT